MPNQTQVEETILNAEYKLATLVNKNLNIINMGGLAVREAFLNYFNLNLQGLKYQDSATDYNCDTTITIYDRLNGFIGIPAGAMIDPNFQQANITIVVQNPVPYLSPMDIPWASFSTDNSPDGGVSRNTYYNTALAGINPFMQDQTTTLLYLGVDYDLIPTGGFILKNTGNLPFIYDGQSLRAYAYQFIGSVPDTGAIRIPAIFADPSGSSYLTTDYLNATYPYPSYIEGDIVTLIASNLQYQRQSNANPSAWTEQQVNQAGT